MDRGIISTISQETGEPIRRRSLKIRDQTGAINITLWNTKVKKLLKKINKKFLLYID